MSIKSFEKGRSNVVDTLSKIPESTPPLNRKNNISLAENAALNQLKNDDSKNFYKDNIFELLEDRENHNDLTCNEDGTITKKIKGLTKEHEHELTKQEIDYIQNFTSKTSNFYGLPKIHTSLVIKAAIKGQNSEYV